MTSKEVVLVIDDTIDNLELISYLVQDAGYICSPLMNGQDAINIAEKVKPALIIVDLMMPEINGFDLIKQFKSHVELSSIPIVMVTSSVRSGDEDIAESLGCVDYITKPIDSDSFIKKIKSWCAFSVLENRLTRVMENMS